MPAFVCSILKLPLDLYRAIVDTLSLGALIWYACLTKRIAQNSVEQLERSDIPFLDLANQPHLEGGGVNRWVWRNYGKGPAINVKIQYEANSPTRHTQLISSLAPGDQYSVGGGSYHEMCHRKYRAEYESISGRRYCTTIEWSKGEKKTKFIADLSSQA